MEAVSFVQPAVVPSPPRLHHWHLPRSLPRHLSPAATAAKTASAVAIVTRTARGAGPVKTSSSAPNASKQLRPLLVLAFLGFAVSNRVFNRMLLVPLKQHTHFLAQATGLAQLLAFCTLLAHRIRHGLVTPDMWRFVEENWGIIAAIGVCEGIFYPIVFCAAAQLPGALVQVLNQSVVPFTVAFGAALLRRRYRKQQLVGVIVVLVAVVVAVNPSAIGSGGAAFKDAALCVAAYALLALGVTLKDAVFARYRETSKFKVDASVEPADLDVCLVCAPAAAVQLATSLLTWPVLMALATPGVGGWRRSMSASVILSGVGNGPVTPLLAISYWTCNVAFSVCTLELVRRASAATVVLANVAALPLSALCFCLPLPLLQRQEFHWHLAASLILAIVGNLIYGSSAMKRR